MEEKKLRTIKIIYTIAGTIGILTCLCILWINTHVFDLTDLDTLTWAAYVITPIAVAIIIVPFLIIGYKWRKRSIMKKMK